MMDLRFIGVGYAVYLHFEMKCILYQWRGCQSKLYRLVRAVCGVRSEG